MTLLKERKKVVFPLTVSYRLWTATKRKSHTNDHISTMIYYIVMRDDYSWFHLKKLLKGYPMENVRHGELLM